MAEQIRWGILGTGWIAHQQTTDLLGNGFIVVAVGSRTQESADAFAAEFGIPRRMAATRRSLQTPRSTRSTSRRRIRCTLRTPHSRSTRASTYWWRSRSRLMLPKRRPSSSWPPRRTSWCSRPCGPGSCRTCCASARSSPRAPSARCARCSPTTTRTCPRIRSTASTTPNSAAERCSISESIPCRSRMTCSAHRPPSRPTRRRPRPGWTARPRSCWATRTGSRPCCTRRSTRSDRTAPRSIGTLGRIEIESVWYTPTPFTVFDSDGAVIEQFDQPVQNRGHAVPGLGTRAPGA